MLLSLCVTLQEFPLSCGVCWLHKYFAFTMSEISANCYLCDDKWAVVIWHAPTQSCYWVHTSNSWRKHVCLGCPGLCMSPWGFFVFVFVWLVCISVRHSIMAGYIYLACGWIQRLHVWIIYEICMAWASTWESGGEGGGQHHCEVRGSARGRPVTMNYTGSWLRGIMGNLSPQ